MKKTISILLAAFISLSLSFAQATEGSLEFDFFNIAADDYSVKSLCPAEDNVMCIVDGTQIDLTFNLGCSEKLASITHEVIPAVNSDVTTVLVKAVAKTPKDRGTFHCLALNVELATIDLVNVYGKIDLLFEGFDDDKTIELTSPSYRPNLGGKNLTVIRPPRI